MIETIWPEKRKVPANTVIGWAQDEIRNGNDSLGYTPETLTVAQAIEVLEDAGAVTFKKMK